jgi:hypothetical protein
MSSNPTKPQPTPEMVAAYLANRLPEADAESFEQYCLEHPEFARDVEAELALRDGLREFAAGAPLGSTQSSPVSSIAPSPRSAHRRRRLVIAAAASVAICAATVLFLQSRPLESSAIAVASLAQWPASLQQATRTQVTLVRTRAASPEPGIVPGKNEVLEIKLLPDAPVSVESPGSSTLYAMSFTGTKSGTSVIFQLTGLRPAADGLITVYVRTAALRGHSVVIHVEPMSQPPARIAGQDFSITVESGPNSQR